MVGSKSSSEWRRAITLWRISLISANQIPTRVKYRPKHVGRALDEQQSFISDEIRNDSWKCKEVTYFVSKTKTSRRRQWLPSPQVRHLLGMGHWKLEARTHTHTHTHTLRKVDATSRNNEMVGPQEVSILFHLLPVKTSRIHVLYSTTVTSWFRIAIRAPYCSVCSLCSPTLLTWSNNSVSRLLGHPPLRHGHSYLFLVAIRRAREGRFQTCMACHHQRYPSRHLSSALLTGKGSFLLY